MYQKQIRPRTAAATPNNRNTRTAAPRRFEIAIDPRRAYVESVCKIWMEGRFGAGYTFETGPTAIDLTRCVEFKRAPLFGPLDDGPIPPDSLTFPFSPPSALKISPGPATYLAVDAAVRRAKRLGLLAAGANATNITANSSSNQGRGSP